MLKVKYGNKHKINIKWTWKCNER